MSYFVNSSNALDWFSYLAAILVVVPVEPCHIHLTVTKRNFRTVTDVFRASRVNYRISLVNILVVWKLLVERISSLDKE